MASMGRIGIKLDGMALQVKYFSFNIAIKKRCTMVVKATDWTTQKDRRWRRVWFGYELIYVRLGHYLPYWVVDNTDYPGLERTGKRK